MSIPHTEQEFKIYALNEQAVTLVFGHEIHGTTASKISNFSRLLNSKPFIGFTNSVPAYTTLSIFYDVLRVMKSDLPGENGFDKVSNYLKSLKSNNQNDVSDVSKLITLPVFYGGEYGPDLEEVSGMTNFSIEELINLHCAAIYKVYMIGFVPGFAYLGGMDERLASPRKLKPRAAVPAGSVGIAGKQTGVYPLETPGGWQIIGQTPLKMFDANRPQPSLLKAGDEVKFQSLSLHEFNDLRR